MSPKHLINVTITSYVSAEVLMVWGLGEGQALIRVVHATK